MRLSALLPIQSGLRALATVAALLVLSGCLGGREDAKDNGPKVANNKLVLLSYDNARAQLQASGTLTVNGALQGSLVRFYLSPLCDDNNVGQGAMSLLSTEGIKIDIPSDKQNNVYAGVAGFKDCALFAIYNPPTEAPAAPTFRSTSPASPSRVSYTPAIFGSTTGIINGVLLYDDAACTHLVGTGTSTEFATVGIQVALTQSRDNQVYGQTSEPFGRKSACALLTTYSHTVKGPAAPTLTSLSPTSPSRTSITPTVIGSNPATSTLIKIFSDAACSTELAHGTPTTFSTTGLQLTVAGNANTAIYAAAYDADGGASLCNYLTTYTHDSTPPSVPQFVSATPASPTRLTPVFPAIKGTADSETALIRFFKDAGCIGQVGSGTRAAFTSTGVNIAITVNSLNMIYATTVDAAGNNSTCTLLTSFLHNNIPPGFPSSASASPNSPTNLSFTPTLTGETMPGTEKLYFYKDNTCTTSIGQGSRLSFESSGIQVTAAANSRVEIYAEAEDVMGNRSECGLLLVYEHSNAPADTVGFMTTSPVSPSNMTTTPVIFGTASNNITFVELFTDNTCLTKVGQGDRSKFVNAGIQVSLPGNYVSSIYAISKDRFNNKSGCTFLTTYTNDSVPPFDPVMASYSPSSPTNSTAPANIKGSVFVDPLKILPPTRVEFYDSNLCLLPIGTGTPAQFATTGIDNNISLNSVNYIYARTFDAAGNFSNCPLILEYTQDINPPGVPIYSTASPASPSFTAKTTLKGSFGPSDDIVPTQKVEFYSDAGCTTKIGGGTPAEFNGVGILVTTSLNQTTSIYAQSTDVVTNKSACRPQLNFAHKDTGPVNLVPVLNADGSVGLTWSPDTFSSPMPVYTLKRSVISGGPYTILYTPSSSTNYHDKTTSSGATYYYVVSASNSTGTSYDSPEVSVAITAGVAATATNLIATGEPQKVNLQWNGFNSDVTFKVLRATQPGGPYTTLKTGVATTVYIDTAVVDGTPYYYVVVGTNPSGDSTYSNEANAVPRDVDSPPTTLVLAPMVAPGLCGSGRAVRLSWSTSAYHDGFVLRRGNTPAGLNDVTNYSPAQHTDDQCPWNYGGNGTGPNYNYYAITTTLGSGQSANSNVVGISEQPPPVARALAGNTMNRIIWSTSFSASSYNVYRSSQSGGPYTMIATGLTSALYDDTLLTNGVGYYYYVQAFFPNGAVGYPSNEVSASPGTDPTVPTGVVVVQDVTKYPAIYWSGSLHSDYFAIYRSNNPTTGFTQVGSTGINTNTLSYVDGGAPAGLWYYKVAAIWGSMTTAMSAATPAFRHGFPLVFTATSKAAAIDLAWTAVTTATEYKVFRCLTADPCATLHHTVTAPAITWSDTSVVVDQSYFYTVQAVFADATVGELSTTVSGRLTGGNKIPTGLTVTGTTNASIGLAWSAIAGATKYTIYLASSPGGPYTAATTTSGSTFNLNTSITFGTQYYIKVSSTTGTVESGLSSAVTATTYDSPSAPIVTVGSGSNSICWTMVTGPSSYAVQRSSDGVNFTNVQSGLTSCPVIDTPVTNGNLYFYRMVATYPDATTRASDMTSPIVPGTQPDAPAGLSVTDNSNGTTLSLSWSAITGASTYQVWRSTTSGSGYVKASASPTVNPLNYTIFGLTAGTTYYLVVTASKGSMTSGYSNEIAVTPAAQPAAPTAIVLPGNTDIRVNWSNVPGAVGYDLQRSTDNFNFTTIASGSSNPYTDVAPPAGVAYYYRFIPYSNVGRTIPMAVSNASSPGIVTGTQNLAPQNLVADVRSSTSVYLRWAKVPNTVTYRILRSTTGGAGTYTQVGQITADAYMLPSYFTDTTALANSTYYYAVTSVNYSGVHSNYSNVVQVSTSSTLPALTANQVGNTIELAWTSTGAGNYVIKRATASGGDFGVLVPSVSGLAYTDAAVENGKTYYYVVAPLSGSTIGTNSNEASATAAVTMNLEVPIELTDASLTSDTSVVTYERTRTSISPADYDGTVTYLFEAVVTNLDPAANSISLIDKDGNVATSLAFAGNQTEPIRAQIAFAAPAAANNYRLRLPATPSSAMLKLHSAKIRIKQVNASKTRLYIPLLASGANATPGDVEAPIEMNATNAYAALNSTNVYTRDTSVFSQLADTNAWELETLVSASGGMTASVALFNWTSNTWVYPTQALFSSPAIQMVRSPVMEGVTNFGTANEGNNYSVVIRCEYNCGVGNAALYKAGLWVRLTNLSKAEIVQRLSIGSSTLGEAYIDGGRANFNATAYSNPTTYFQVNGSSPTLNTVTVRLMDAGTNDQGVVGLTPVAGSALNFGSSVAQMKRTTAITLTGGNRYLPGITNPASNDVKLLDASLIIRAQKN